MFPTYIGTVQPFLNLGLLKQIHVISINTVAYQQGWLAAQPCKGKQHQQYNISSKQLLLLVFHVTTAS